MQVIRLPEDIFWPFGSDTGTYSTLFVRSSQEDTYNKIYNKYREYVLSSEKPELMWGYAIYGSSGIGKAASLNFLLYVASELDVNVVIHRSRHFLYVLRRDGTVISYDPEDVRHVPELWSWKTLYLYTHGDDEDHIDMYECFIVIASTPVRQRHKAITKSGSFILEQAWMFGWSLEEVIVACQALQPNVKLSDDKIARIKQRYYDIGGALALHLLSEPEYEKMLSVRNKRLQNITLADLDWLLRTAMYSHDFVPHERSPFMIFDFYPPKVDKTEKYPRQFAVGFVSPGTQRVIEDAMDFDSKGERKAYREFKAEHFAKVSPEVTGYYYELDFRNYMRTYKSQPKLRIFNDKHEEEVLLSKAPTYMESNDLVQDIVHVLLDSKCTYIVPQHLDYLMVDAFYVLKNTLYLFMISVNGKYAVNTVAVQSFTNEIEILYRALSQGKELTWKYVVVSELSKEELDLEPGSCYIRWRNLPFSAEYE